MTIGERIKRIRVMRGMTQRDLGVIVGFPERSADVRIAQYESGKRVPKQTMIELIAEALNVNPHSLEDLELNTDMGLMYTLFELENTWGFHITHLGGNNYGLVLDKEDKRSNHVNSLLADWSNAYESFENNPSSLTDYAEWKLNYPPVINKK